MNSLGLRKTEAFLLKGRILSQSDSPIKVEKVLAELNRLRTDLDKDPTDPEWFALHHAFCFVSYKIGEFQAYLDETVKPGEHPEG